MCKTKEIRIVCFINSLWKFTKNASQNPKSLAIFLAMLVFFCKAIFGSKFGRYVFYVMHFSVSEYMERDTLAI